MSVLRQPCFRKEIFRTPQVVIRAAESIFSSVKQRHANQEFAQPLAGTLFWTAVRPVRRRSPFCSTAARGRSTLVIGLGRSARRNTYYVVILEFEFTCRVMVHPVNFLRHFSLRSVLTSVCSVSNSGF